MENVRMDVSAEVTRGGSSRLAYLLPGLTLLWPLVNFANSNRTMLATDYLLWILVYGVFGGSVLCGVTWVALRFVSERLARRIAFTLAVGIVLFFFHKGILSPILGGLAEFGIMRGGNVGYAIVFLASLPIAWLIGACRRATQLAVVFVAVAITLPGISLILHVASSRNPGVEERQIVVPPARFKPNVYVLITDAYARQDILARHFSFDNEPFLAELARMGYNVRRDAIANYYSTAKSLTTLLQMDYTATPEAGYFDYPQAVEIIRGRSATVQRFRAHGYGFAHATTRITRMGCRDAEDMCLDSIPPNVHREALRSLLGMTPLERVAEFILGVEPNETLHDIRQGLERIPRDRPFFAFVHTYSPHPPNFVDAPCNRNPSWTSRLSMRISARLNGAYVDAVRCVNSTILELARWLEARDPAAIVIFMSDHGKIPQPDWTAPSSMRNASPAERLPNLLAVHMPPACISLSGTARSLVNVMVVIFACIEGRAPKLRRDRFFIQLIAKPIQEVTDVLERAGHG